MNAVACVYRASENSPGAVSGEWSVSIEGRRPTPSRSSRRREAMPPPILYQDTGLNVALPPSVQGAQPVVHAVILDRIAAESVERDLGGVDPARTCLHCRACCQPDPES